MNGRDGFTPPGGGSDDSERMEAAGVVDAQSGAHNALENAQSAFPTAPTRINVIMVRSKKCYLCPRTDLLPRSPAAQIAITRDSRKTSAGRFNDSRLVISD
jgi:hypothetical protein